MDLDIKGLRVLVTAGANGIGLAIARAFVREGAKVHTCDVDEAALAALDVSDPAITQTKCDVSDRKAVKRLFEEVTGNPGVVDEHVEAAEISGHFLEKPLHGLAVGHIAFRLGDGRIAHIERRQCRIIDIAGVNLGAFANERSRDGKPDAIGAGRDQHAQALDIEIHDCTPHRR